MDHLFFFSSRRRHTRCGRDWSSDVCSSDLMSGFHVSVLRSVMTLIILSELRQCVVKAIYSLKKYKLKERYYFYSSLFRPVSGTVSGCTCMCNSFTAC